MKNNIIFINEKEYDSYDGGGIKHLIGESDEVQVNFPANLIFISDGSKLNIFTAYLRFHEKEYSMKDLLYHTHIDFGNDIINMRNILEAAY